MIELPNTIKPLSTNPTQEECTTFLKALYSELKISDPDNYREELKNNANAGLDIGMRKLPLNYIDHGDYGDFILAYCRFCQYQTLVEVGVGWGCTTLKLCEAAKITGGKVFGYDFFSPIGTPTPQSPDDVRSYKITIETRLRAHGYEPPLFKLTKVNTKSDELVQLLKEDVGEPAKTNPSNKGIDFAFIDADHSYSGVKNDFLKVYPFLKNEGSIFFHDTFNHVGCRKFVLDLYQDLNDGTFDIINLPYGYGGARCGLTMLSKRSYPLYAGNCNVSFAGDVPQLSREEVHTEEKEWYKKQLTK
jgi:hypothetical protein